MKKWKKITLWVAGPLVLVVAIMASLLLLLRYSHSFQGFLLSVAEQKVNQSTGARLSIKNFTLQFSPPRIDVYGIVVHGAKAGSDKPLFTAEHVGVGFSIDSVLHLKWHLRDAVIDRPIVHVFVNPAGKNNLPATASEGKSHLNIFNFAVRSLQLHRGAIFYNDRENALEAALHDLQISGTYDGSLHRYQGRLSYREGNFRFNSHAPIAHDLDAIFEVTPEKLVFERLSLAAAHSHVDLHGAIENYTSSDRSVRAEYDADVAAGDLSLFVKTQSLPAGTLHVSGSAQYENEPGRPLVQGLSTRGKLNSSTLLVGTMGYRAEIHDLDAAYFLRQGNVRVENLRARILGGTFVGSLDVRDITGANEGSLSATLRDISLDRLETVSHSTTLQQSELTGNFAADTRASWSGSLKNLTVQSDANIQAKVGRTATPLDGAFHVNYSAVKKELGLRQSYVRTPQTSIELNGTVSRKSRLQVKMESRDLHELEVLGNDFRQSFRGESPAQLGLHGAASFTGSVSGVITNPQVAGQMDVHNLEFKGRGFDLFHAGIRADPSLLSLNNARLVSKNLGQFDFDLQTGLEKWAYTKTSPIKISASASHVSVKDLMQLAGMNYPVSGTLAMEIQVSGTQLNPAGHGNIRLTEAVISGQPVQNLTADFQGNGSSVHANLALRMKAGTAQAKVTYAPKSESYEGELKADNIILEQLKVLEKHDLQLRGKVNMNASGKGTVESPQIVAEIEIPELQVRQQAIRGVKLQAKVRNEVADISFTAEAAQTHFSGHGSVGIKAPYKSNLTLDSGSIPLEPLLALYAPKAKDISGRTELHVTVSGPLAEKDKLEAHLKVPVLKVDYGQLKFSAAQPLSVDYKNGEAVLRPASIQGTATHLNLQAKIPVAHPMKSSFQVQGTVDLAIVSLFNPALETTGRLQIDVHSIESTGAISYSGVMKLVDASLESSTSPWTLTNANGEFTITNDRVQIETFQAKAGEGSISARGEISYRPAVQFNVAVNAQGLRLVYPDGIRSRLAADLSLTGTEKSSTLRGSVKIGEVSFLPDFDLNNFASQFRSGLSSSEASEFERNLHLNLTIQSVSQMNLESSKVSIQGNLNVRAKGTLAAPVLLGRMALTGGDVFFRSNRYLIQSGTIDFINPVRIEPVVNLRLQTTVNQYNIGLNINGPTDRLRLSYSSDPALPPADIINLLAFGATTEEKTPSASGTLGAETLLAKGVTSVASSRVEKFAGLSHFSINPALGGDNQNPGARIAIQERVTSNLYVTYATDVTSTQRQAIELKYQINRRWSVSGVRDQNGGLGADVHYRKNF